MSTELLQVESRYWNSMKDRDPREAEALTGDDCVIVGSQGVMAVTGEMVGKMLEDPTWTIDRYALDESKAQVRMIREDIAIVAYPVHEELRVEGKKVSLDAFDATVWVKKEGEWVSVLHTESIAGDPFGRDKKKPAKRTAGRKPTPRTKPAAKKTAAKKPRKTIARKRTRARSR